MRWLYYRGSPKVGFHCIIIIIIIIIIDVFLILSFLKETKQSALQVLILKSSLGVLQWWNAANVTFCFLKYLLTGFKTCIVCHFILHCKNLQSF